MNEMSGDLRLNSNLNYTKTYTFKFTSNVTSVTMGIPNKKRDSNQMYLIMISHSQSYGKIPANKVLTL